MSKSVREIYGKNELESCIYNYQPMIDSFGQPIIQIDDDGYSGDTRVFFYDNVEDRFGHLIFGWGSCSVCDALQGCINMDEVQELYNELENDIKWFKTKAEALEWFNTHDWEGNYYGHCEETKKYVDVVKEYLR